MAVISTDHIATASETFARGAFAHRIADLRARFAKWRLYRRTMRELGDLTDAELNDLGMARPGIRFVAWHAVYG